MFTIGRIKWPDNEFGPILIIRRKWPVNEYEAVLVIRPTTSPDNETLVYYATFPPNICTYFYVLGLSFPPLKEQQEKILVFKPNDENLSTAIKLEFDNLSST